MGLSWILQKCMNENDEKNEIEDESGGGFVLCNAPQIRIEHHRTLNKIKNYFEFKDARECNDLWWWRSKRLNLYLYGKINRFRPVGPCFFYVYDHQIVGTPRCICTYITEQFVFSSKTLALFCDDSFYIGEMKTEILGLPQAQGKGTLVFKDVIYEGQFKNGKPNGYGRVLSRFGQLTGEFKDGLPQGELVQRTTKGLFVGSIDTFGMKRGTLITPTNEQIKITDTNQNAFFDQDIYSII